jgi:hypothetical protein
MPSIDQLLPGEGAILAAPAQPVWPRTLGRLANDFAPLAVAPSTLVWGIATPCQPDGLLRLLAGRLAVGTTPRPSPLHAPPPAFPARLPLADPVSTACLGPRGGKAAQGAGPRAPRRWVATWWPLARRHHRLCGRHGPAETGKPPREACQPPAGVGCHRAADEKSCLRGGTAWTHHAAKTRGRHPCDTRGELPPPCGAPVAGDGRAPDASTPAWSHWPSRRPRPPSLPRGWLHARSGPPSRGSKHPLPSASTLQARCNVRHGSRRSWSAWG